MTPAIKPRESLIHFLRVTTTNWRQVIALSVQPGQERFVPPAATTLAQSFLAADGSKTDPFGVYAGHALVGFFACTFFHNQPQICNWGGFLIDRRYQGLGLGRMALDRFLDLVHVHYPQCNVIRLNVHPDNKTAIRLYRQTGFKPAEPAPENNNPHLKDLLFMDFDLQKGFGKNPINPSHRQGVSDECS